MRAYMIDQFKTPGRLDDVPLPAPKADEIRVRVTAAGVNPIDWKIRAGSAPDLPLPRVLGQDIAGVVDAVGSEVSRFTAGDRVLGCARTHGGFADMTVIAQDAKGEPVAKIPGGLDDAVAGALPTPGLTALGCLNAAAVGTGTPMVIIGAGGAVGSIATQLAVLRGARVIAAVKPEDAASVRAFAPQQTIASSATGDIVRAVRDAFPDGAAAVLDFVSDGERLKAFADVLSATGTIVTTTHAADESWFAARGLRAVNFVLADAPECSPAGLNELTGLLAAGKLSIAIRDECPLNEARRVLDESEQHALRGKHVIRPTALR